MRRLRSTTLHFAGLVFLLQIAGAGAVLLSVAALTNAQINAEAADISQDLNDALIADFKRGGTTELQRAIEERAVPGRVPRSVMLLVDKGGRPIAGNLTAWPDGISPTNDAATVELYRTGHDLPDRMRVTATELPGGHRLLTGTIVTSELRFTGVMEGAMVSALLLAAALAGFAAWIAARIIAQSLGDTVRTSSAVAAGDLDRRVPLSGSGDAFDALGHAVNDMLDRIAALMGELKIATDGLAHDLRSPLTRLHSMLERAQAATPDPIARAAIDRALDEGERLLSMLDTALRITRAEAGLGREVFTRTDIGALLADMAEVYGPLAEDRGTAITSMAGTGFVAPAHHDLLQQAVANLLDNALKYGIPKDGDGAIVLDARASGDGLIAISVADNGPGIAADRRAEALRRFGRLDAARSESGAGLGLALATAVARLHGGTLELRDNAPGLLVRFTIASHAAPR